MEVITSQLVPLSMLDQVKAKELSSTCLWQVLNHTHINYIHVRVLMEYTNTLVHVCVTPAHIANVCALEVHVWKRPCMEEAMFGRGHVWKRVGEGNADIHLCTW